MRNTSTFVSGQSGRLRVKVIFYFSVSPICAVGWKLSPPGVTWVALPRGEVEVQPCGWQTTWACRLCTASKNAPNPSRAEVHAVAGRRSLETFRLHISLRAFRVIFFV